MRRRFRPSHAKPAVCQNNASGSHSNSADDQQDERSDYIEDDSTSRDRTTFVGSGIPDFVLPNFEDTARNIFLTLLAKNDATKKIMGGCYHVLGPVISRASSNSPLHAAVMAAAVKLGVLWSLKSHRAALSRRYYTRAVNSLRLAIDDNARNSDDDVLMTVMFLDYYDSIDIHFWTSQPSRLRSHRAGALALARHRGSKNFKTDISKSILVSIQTMGVEEALQGRTHLHRSYQILFQDSAMPKTMLSRLNAITITLAELMARVQHPGSCNNLPELCRRFVELDARFDSWHNHFLVDYYPRKVTGAEIPAFIRRAGVYRDICSVYPNVEAANLVTLWRYRRLLLLHTLQNCVPLVNKPDITPLADMKESLDAIVQTLADGICETVPLFLGEYSSSKSTPTSTYSDVARQPESSEISTFSTSLAGHSRLATEGGGWMMLTPLHTLARLMRGTETLRPLKLREGQQEWVENQIQRLQ